MSFYYVPPKEIRCETVIKHSRFIGVFAPIEDYDDGVAFVLSLKREFANATHVCYAFISDEMGREQKFSDDGEPQGTAGQPILDVLKKRNIKKAVLAVVRYFGGIKLGANGLVSAYSGSASSVINEGALTKMVYSTLIEVETDYTFAGKVRNILSDKGDIKDCIYDSGVLFKVTILPESIDSITTLLMDATSGNVIITERDKKYYPTKD